MFCNHCGGRVRRDRHRHLYHVATGRKWCPKLGVSDPAGYALAVAL